VQNGNGTSHSLVEEAARAARTMNLYSAGRMQFCQEHNVHYDAAKFHCGECFRQQQKENAKLKEVAASWKGGWYETREIIGKLSWTVPNVRVLKDSPSPFFRQQYQKFIELARGLEEETSFREALQPSFEKDPFASPLMPLLGDD
jgi:hypothetical protein